jgi:predicted nucleic acid-binding protein
MMTTALEQAARNNVASELEQVTREARYLAFRYIAELGVALFPDHMRPIADERIMHWFRWTVAKVLKRYARVMQRLRVAETSRAPAATTATDQFASSKEALDRGQVANALIKLCLDRGHAATARAVLEDLAQRQESTSLNAETLSLLVRYWAQVGNEEQAVKTIERIRSMGSGLKPTETAYVAMLELAASRGDVQAALNWMRALERELGCESPERVSSDGVPFKASMPSEQAFFALFQCLRKAAAAETAMNLLHEYGVRYGYQPSPLVYEIVYETCLRGSRIDYMRQLRQEIQQRGVTLPPLDSLNV